MNIAERIKTVRGESSQEEFARDIGIHKNSLGRYERGESTPGMDVAIKICFVFGVSPHWLLLGEGPMKMENVLSSTYAPVCLDKMEALERRVAELEAENVELRKEAMVLYKDALNAYKRLYECLQSDSAPTREAVNAFSKASESASLTAHANE